VILDREALQAIGEKIRIAFDAKDAVRERVLTLSREMIRNSANAIRAIHRQEYAEARTLMEATAGLLTEIEQACPNHPDVYWAGFVQDAQKEYAESRITYALIRHEPLPDPDALGVGYAAYLNGMGEAVGEMRRHVLDQIRTRGAALSEALLQAMDDIYYLLVSMDYPAAISGGLRRTADVTRSIIEKTRGDLTGALRSQQLEEVLLRVEETLKARKEG
jgi:translin